MRLVPRPSLLAAMAAVAALAGAGCGDDEEDTAAEDTAGDTAAQETTGDDAGAASESSVAISALDFEFDPEDASIGEDGQVEIELTNDGDAPHAIVIEETEDASDTIEGGESTTLAAELDSGDYTMFCPVADHRELGMEGTLTVGGGSGSESGSVDDDAAEGSASDDGEDDSGESDDSGGAIGY